MIELVAAAHRAERRQQRETGQRQVADHVEGLVAGALVGITQPLGIQQAGVVEHHRVLERCAAGKAGLPELGDVAEAAEGAGAADLAAEALGVQIDGEGLPADHLIGEIDLDLGAEAVGPGAQFGEAVARTDLNRLENLDVTARGALLRDSGLVDRGDEAGGAAVHDRHFGAIDLDGGVVDAHSP